MQHLRAERSRAVRRGDLVGASTQVLLIRGEERGGVVKWMPDFLRSASDDVAAAVKRLRVGDTLAVDGMTIKRTA